jgi:hypothetical protein
MMMYREFVLIEFFSIITVVDGQVVQTTCRGDVGGFCLHAELATYERGIFTPQHK